LLPWIAEWQLVQARSSNCCDGAVPPAGTGKPRPLNAGVVCWLPAWQPWHSQGGRTFSKGAIFDPCDT